MDRVQGLLNDFIHCSKTELADQLDLELAQIMVQTLEKILTTLVAKDEKGVDCSEVIRKHLQDIFVIALKCLATFQSFRLNGKPDPEHIVEAKKGVSTIFKLC